MDIAVEIKIRERAYALWLESGMSEGEAEHHWLHAEKAVRAENKAVAKPVLAKPVFAEKAVRTKTAETKKAKASIANGQASKAAAPRRAKASVASKAVEATAC